MPAWLAWIEHWPTATSVTVVPDTVQTGVVVDAKLTVKPDEAVALTVKAAVPSAWLDSDPNVIVWLPAVTWKLSVTGVAAA